MSRKNLKLQLSGVEVEIKQSITDRLIEKVSPQKALKRLQARALMALHTGGYEGAKPDRGATKSWWPSSSDADGDLLGDLETLRGRSRDLVRNSPLAGGALSSVVTNVVGTGLQLQARLDRKALGLDEDTADAWESSTEREWRLWSESTNADLCRTLDFAGIQEIAFRQTLENGDIFLLRRHRQRPDTPYTLCLQLVEADRVCNPNFTIDTPNLAGGIEKDKDGAPVNFHILKEHPGSQISGTRTWTKFPVYGDKSGARTAIHLYKMQRPGQSRGIPYLAPVIEPLKQLARYTEAEIMAAVVSGMFTVFVKSDIPGGGLAGMGGTIPNAPDPASGEYQLAPGAIIDLAREESIETANPGRPNTAFDPFVQAVLRQIGVALELPYEFLIKHYTSSYTAARAAILDAWRFFLVRRNWLERSLCQPIYELWMIEAVSSGRIAAPGFFTDPIIRKAWLGSEWIGPSKGSVDELKEINAATKRLDLGVSTLAEETSQLTGGDWERKHQQRVKEVTRRRKDGLEEDPAAILANPAPTRSQDDDQK
ncbi:phage portal protein [bacterium]|nr:phage portal protein [bacterium]